jgi:hypothetical protein
MAGRVDQCLDLVSDPREWPRNAIKSFGEGYYGADSDIGTVAFAH